MLHMYVRRRGDVTAGTEIASHSNTYTYTRSSAVKLVNFIGSIAFVTFYTIRNLMGTSFIVYLHRKSSTMRAGMM